MGDTWHTITINLTPDSTTSFERYGDRELLQLEYNAPLNELYGIGNWSITISE